jgi:tRNA/rRNA methyltransferase
MTAFDNISIVLVEPQHPGNVGMVCRAMKNMGLNNLRIVKGCRIDHPDAVKFAVSAKELLGMARHYESLADALADTEISRRPSASSPSLPPRRRRWSSVGKIAA